MSIIIERLIASYSQIKLARSIICGFIIFSASYLIATHEKIITFSIANHDINIIKENIIQVKQKILADEKIIQQIKLEKDQGFRIRSGGVKQLIETVKQFELAQYRMDDFLQKKESDNHIKILQLSLRGKYFKIIHWLIQEMPFFCSLKQIVFKRMQNGMVNLTIKVEVYEE